MKTILEVQVWDRPGVLDRIVGLIRRRSWNINSLTVGDISPGLSQIIFQLEGRDVDLATLGEHLSEMDAVCQWQELTEQTGVLREMVLFRVGAEHAALADSPGVRVVAERDGLRYCEYTDAPSAIDAYIRTLRGQGVACVRTGPLSLVEAERGEGCV